MDPSVETEEKLQAEEEAAKQRLETMQRSVPWPLPVTLTVVAEEEDSNYMQPGQVACSHMLSMC